MYYNNIQSKNDEINKLKADLRQSQIQLQVLRKTMEQMLKADGREVFYEDDFEYKLTKKKSFYENDDNRCLLLQTGYQPDHLSASSLSSKGSNTNKPTTNPPSPTPCYLPSEDDSPYGFLNDPFVMESDTQQRFSLAKRKSEDFTKKLELSRRRKDQIEEMLGEVDSQLSRVKQKIRTPSACEK
ncbi:hypothetical protein BDB01DRAFT_171643 [Pilobolus umbonatus]|nr:hypothetical protein BDB01DRAFT_171643 [Pilobolus umbonatus]